jgi:hypothetical protein
MMRVAAIGLKPRVWRLILMRHSCLVLISINFLLLSVMGLFGEVLLRATISYHIDYYTGIRSPGKIQYPFGTITINSYGYPDDEFDLMDNRIRIGYVGDSVTFGIGAGQGYRISDIIKQAMPAYQHMTFSMVKYGIHDIEKFVQELRPFRLHTVIYLMNLNDMLADEQGDKPLLPFITKMIQGTIDAIRPKSYLYNYMRSKGKFALTLMGYGHHGHKAIELFPETNDRSIKNSMQRVNTIAKQFGNQGVRFCIVILPYEMQISESAEKEYRALGFRWDKTFVNKGTQQRILHYLQKDVEVLDGYYAFVDSSKAESSRSENGIGQYFVYNKGDKIDWNHLNRRGHRQLAEYILHRHFCGLG